jgi:eukaryotic-like serine/threonine-protein kinase
MGLQPGTRLGPYEILSPLGAGGMGEVYRARDTRLGRDVAIKVLPEHLSSFPDFRQRFEREARAISSLQHPHICVLYDVGREEAVGDFLVMELLEGETVAERLRKGKLGLEELIKIGMEIADALDKAHRKGVIHRDLKPANIMLTKSGSKLMDFGLAKPAGMGVAAGSGPAPLLSAAMTASGPSPASPLTSAGMLVGTIQYMSPEQIEGKEADARSDIFAFGAVLYEMATGARAFLGKSQISVASAILEKDPEPISKTQPLVPATLDRVVANCLAKNPDERFQCAYDLGIELKWVAEADLGAGLVPAPGRPQGSPLRRAFPWAMAAAGFLAAAILGGLVLRSRLAPSYSVHSYILPPEKTTFSAASLGPVAVSPDGRRIAFVARASGGQSALWVETLNSATAQPLAGTEGATFPFWSADSRYLGFFAGGKLEKVEASGGPAQALCSAPGARGGAWNHDGTIVFAGSFTGGLSRVEASGGTPVPLTQLAKNETSHRWPWFLPDGKHYLYFAHGITNADNGIYAGSLGSNERTLLLRNDSNANYAEPGYLLFIRNGTLMAQRFNPWKLALVGDAAPIADHVGTNSAVYRGVFTASANGVLLYLGGGAGAGSQLFWIDRTGKQGEMAIPDAGIYHWPALSPDGKKLAVAIYDAQGNSDIWVVDLARKTKSRITFGPSENSHPVWWPDGKSVVFGSLREGTFHAYRKAADGTGNDEKLLETPGLSETPYSISPDGRYVAYGYLDPNSGRGSDIYALPVFGARKPFPIVNTQFNEAVPAISQDGKWLAYMSNDTGQFEVYIRPFPGGEGKWQVSTAGGFIPRWRGDGKELFFLASEREMLAVDVRGNGTSVELGTPHKLFLANTVASSEGPYAVSADGQRFLINGTTAETGSEPLTLVTNWPADLKK